MSNYRDVYSSVLTPLTFLQRSVAVYPGKPAVVHGARRYTYAEFGERVNRLASGLRARGLAKGERVAFLCPNIPPMLEAHFGVMLAGGILVTINTRLAPAEIQYILAHSGSTFLFADTEYAATVTQIRGQCPELQHVIHITDDPAFGKAGGEDYEEFLASGRPAPVPWVVEDEYESITINYTSGTTGRPKGVTFCHRGAYINALGEVLETAMTADSVYLWTLPMFHCNGWCFTWGVTALGATHVCLRKFEPAAAWQLIERERVTHFNGAPVVLIALLNNKNAPKQLERPLTITTAGAPPSPTLIENVRKLGANIIHVYGLTEVYGPFTVCAWQPEWRGLSVQEQGKLLARQGVGYLVGAPTRVVDEDMNDVPADGQTMGEAVMQGNMVMKGYWDEPEATEKGFRGGWFHSGDVAVMHPDGYIELRDRSKDIIISGGENISSIEVEQALYRHPAVLEVAVVAAPHVKWGETPKAFVTLKEGAEVSEADLIAFCRQQIAHFKCPSSIQFGPLPKTSTGKIQKFVLREREWAGEEKRIKGA
ncbi:MAG: long-chain-fatty-acid--CoA ligase [Candidatus Hydrogenedentes bacterium]|nr:long-chain-fatty-acid--CoA ligase [Candidatus Hydrogenedentota bacterium]